MSSPVRQILVRPGRVATRLAAVLAVVATGCALPPPDDLERRAEASVGQLEAEGVHDDPGVAAQLAEFEAALEREKGAALVDEVELRTATQWDDDRNSVSMLARVPINNPLALPADRDALRARTRVALAELEEMALERRVQLCLPSLEQEVRAEHRAIYAEFAAREIGLGAWSRELHEAGILDDVTAARFELASATRLAAREPAPLAEPSVVLPVLPPIAAPAERLDRDLAVLREIVARHNPSVAIHRALGERYDALARAEHARSLPSVRFVDFGFEPLAPQTGAGGSRQPPEYRAQVAVEIPLGASSRADAARYRARARGQASAERMALDDRVETLTAALLVIDAYEQRSARWTALLELAESAEAVADGWWHGRLTEPRDISALVDDVYDARLAVLEAREQAGIAACTVLGMGGIAVDAWPRR